jgi:uncharacterized protein
MKSAIIIFVRNPQPGKVKTRLAATLGDEKALQVYKELLLHTKQITTPVAADKYVYYFEEIATTDLWDASGFFKKLQCDDDLGGKMKHAFKELFAAGYEDVIIIGSDCFELTTAIIGEAFTLLKKNDAVIGPAKDGGYYLLGMKKLIEPVFENKQWSTDTVFGQTINDFTENNFSFVCLPVLTDIDTEADLNCSGR